MVPVGDKDLPRRDQPAQRLQGLHFGNRPDGVPLAIVIGEVIERSLLL